MRTLTLSSDRTAAFWAKGLRVGECLIWQGALTRAGYGAIRIDYVTWCAHVVAYILTYGSVEEYVLHRCDVRSCFEPAHLFEGTQRDNMQDSVTKGRHIGRLNLQHPSGAAHPLATLSLAQVQEIREAKGKILQRELADRYGVVQATISRIQTRARWPDDNVERNANEKETKCQ